MKKTLFITLFACFFIYTLLCYPQSMFTASANSVSVWFSQVLPSLFPFLVICGLLFRLGIAERMGKLFSPLMRPLFRLPGIAAFPFFLGILSGYPMGAKITAMLYAEEKITLDDAQHILAFTNNAGPLFLVGTVASVFLGVPYWGYAFLLSSFLGALTTGILYRFLKPKTPISLSRTYACEKKEVPNFSDALSFTIDNAMETTTQIGGYIILFGVISQALKEVDFFAMLSRVLFFLPTSEAFLQGFFSGILEMTNGALLLANAPDNAALRLCAICFIVSFGGLSILGQTFGVLHAVPIDKFRYVLCKLCNACLSSIYFLLFYPYFEKQTQKAVPAYLMVTETAPKFSNFAYILLLASFLFLIAYRKKHHLPKRSS